MDEDAERERSLQNLDALGYLLDELAEQQAKTADLLVSLTYVVKATVQAERDRQQKVEASKADTDWARRSAPAPELTKAERSARARLAASTRWSRLTTEERRAATAPARRAFADTFASAPNPEAAEAAHMAKMQLAKAKKTRRRPAPKRDPARDDY